MLHQIIPFPSLGGNFAAEDLGDERSVDMVFIQGKITGPFVVQHLQNIGIIGLERLFADDFHRIEQSLRVRHICSNQKYEKYSNHSHVVPAASSMADSCAEPSGIPGRSFWADRPK